MTKHTARAPKAHPGTRRHLRYIDCSCGWTGRVTTPEGAVEEHRLHASGVVQQWEVYAANFDAILAERRRQAAK